MKKTLGKINGMTVEVKLVEGRSGNVFVEFDEGEVMREVTRDKIWMWVAWKMPKTLVKWCAVRLMAHATQGRYDTQVVPELSAMDALKRWGV